MLKRKSFVQAHKAAAEARLAARIDALLADGMPEDRIRRDTMVRHFKGKIRQASHQLTGIAELEHQIEQKHEAKAAKQAIPKTAAPKKKGKPDPVAKKAKKDKKAAAAAAETAD